MDLLTIVIFVALVFASIGAWLVFGFLRYRSYFQRVRHALIAVGCDDIWHLPPEKLQDVDDAVRRCYFARAPLHMAAERAIEAIASLSR